MPRNRKEKMGSVKTDPLYTSDDFRMYCFKVMPCSRHYTHDWTECPFAHPGEKATRRDPRLYSYVGIECPHVKGEANKCPRGDGCPFAHNVFECWLHPSRYRTQMCNEPATCRRKICFFAHSMEEMREPTPVSKNMDLGLKTGPKRITTNPETKPKPSPRVRPETQQRRNEVKSNETQTRTSFDVSRKPPTIELPPRPSLDSSTSRLAAQAKRANQNTSSSLNQQQNPQLLSLIAMLQQQQQQQQQEQMKCEPVDLSAALAQVSLSGNQLQLQGLQQEVYTPGQLVMNSGQPDHVNDLLSFYLQQSSLNNTPNVPHNPSAFPLAMANVQTQCAAVPAVSNQVLLQQLQQLQNLQDIGAAAGLRSSFESTMSSGSGTIPARVSFDNVTSAAPSLIPQAGLNYLNMGSLRQSLFSGIATPDRATEYVYQRPQARSSTESSVTDSFGCMSGDTYGYESLRQMQNVQEQGGPLAPLQSNADDFISFDQGSNSFFKANVVSPNSGGSTETHQ